MAVSAISAYRNYMRIGKQVVFMVVFACGMTGLFYTFSQLRIGGVQTERRIIESGFYGYLASLMDLAGTILRNIELAATIVGNLAEPPLSVQWSNPTTYMYSTKWIAKSRQILDPSPKDYFIATSDGSYMQVTPREGDDSHIMDIYFTTWSNEMGMWEMRRTNISYVDDIISGDLNDNELLSYVPMEDMTWKVNGHRWSTMYRLAATKGERRLTYVHAYEDSYRNGGVVGCTFETWKLHDIMKEAMTELSSFAVITLDNQTIMTSDDGALGVYEKKGKLYYPTLGEMNSTKWSAVYNLLNTTEMYKLFEFKDGETPYWGIIMNISTGDHVVAKCVCVMNMANADLIVFSPVTFYFVVELTMIMIVGALVIYLKQKIAERRKRRLMVMPNRDPVFEQIGNFGTIGTAIQNIRHLELMFPEDTTLNRVLDKSMNYLSARNNVTFSPTEEREDCQFCANVLNEKKQIPQLPRNLPYQTWLKRFTRKTHKCDFDIAAIEADPTKKMVNVIVSLMNNQSILMLEFNPDSIVRFVVDFTTKYALDDVYVALITLKLYQIMRSNFKNWVPNKIEKLALYFAMMVSEMAFPENENASILCDRESKLAFEIAYIMNLLKQYFPMMDKSEEGRHFWYILERVYSGLKDDRTFEMMGQLRIRCESFTFSVQDDLEERILFLTNLLRLCKLSPYIMPLEEMPSAVQHITSKYFTKEEAADAAFVAKFHLIQSRRIVKPLVDLFSMYASFSDIKKNLESTMKYWSEQINPV